LHRLNLSYTIRISHPRWRGDGQKDFSLCEDFMQNNRCLIQAVRIAVFGFFGVVCGAGRFAWAEETLAAPDVSTAAPVAETAQEVPAMSQETPAMSQEGPTFVGADTCVSCHEAQGAAFQNGLHNRTFTSKKNIPFEKSCETCHGPGSLHVASGGDPSAPGFATLRSFRPKNARADTQACLACHQDSERSHWSSGPHQRAGVTCFSCHSVHSVKGEHGQLVKGTQRETCYQCHGDVKGQMRRSAHMPVEEDKMTCSSCHDPHGTATPKALKSQNVNQLCYQCHQDKRGPHLWEHLPVRENCLNCHS
jgi:DmsE family decaheme c-type cytochrome